MNAPDENLDLPPPPEQGDCCFSGCAQCVLDTYTEELAAWRAECEAIRARHAAAKAAAQDPADPVE